MNRSTLRYLLGQGLATLLPQRTAAITQGFTIPCFAEQAVGGRVDHLIRHYLGHRFSGDQHQLESMHKQFWQNQGPRGWHRATAERFEKVYLPTFGDLVISTQTLLDRAAIENVVEFGTGNGDWLAYLHSQWSHGGGPQRFVGLDLAEAQIQQNQQAHPHLEFHSGDLVDWIGSQRTKKTLFVTHCGVLEYLSQKSLADLLAKIRQNHPQSMLLFVEPIADDFDLKEESKSRMQGAEFSYSHNYPELLLEAGFELIDQQERSMEDFRMLCVTAIAK